MRVAEQKAIARERGLRGYSRLRKAELIALLQNNPPPPPQSGVLQELHRKRNQLGLDQIDRDNLNL